MKDPAPYGPGPWGGDGGKPWDDGVFTGIKQIILSRGDAICSIEIEYDRNGQSIWSVKHGGSMGESANSVRNILLVSTNSTRNFHFLHFDLVNVLTLLL